MSAPVPVVTIDGPSGSGKGAISQRLAADLGWHFLDSGAIYRILALAALARDIPLDDEPALVELAGQLDIDFEPVVGGEPLIRVDGAAVGSELRTETCGDAASRLAVLPAVRTALLARQRAFRRPPGLVADGRDMGTVVFPDAGARIFLTASAEARAKRRYKQLIEKGLSANLTRLIDEIRARDERDAGRAVSPLVPAEGARVLDTTQLDENESYQSVRQYVNEQLGID